MQWLEEQGHEYLVKVKLKGLTDLLDAQEWSSIESQSGWAQSSFKYKCEKWDEPRTFVAVRQKAKEQDENLLGLVKYDYFCYVTSDNRSPWEIHKKYGERATCETWIEEAKNQMALAHIKSNSFEATSALFQCSIIAYNLLRWMALCSDSKVLKRGEPQTVRMCLIRTAGKLLTGSRKLQISYTNHHIHPEAWDEWLRLGNLVA